MLYHKKGANVKQINGYNYRKTKKNIDKKGGENFFYIAYFKMTKYGL
jgi:hypothetical protein